MSTFRRLLGFLGPYRRRLLVSLFLAWLAMVASVAIPWLIGHALNAIEEQRRADILPLVLAIAGAGLLRLGLTFARRLVAGEVSLGVEYDLRQRFYTHLQRLELGFFDGQQTGQLMSRATVDLSAIRFFLGYGLIFLTQSFLTIILASTVMFIYNPELAALALAPIPVLVAVAVRYSLRNRPAIQEVQQRMGELTSEAEESVTGIRVVKAFAREAFMERRFQRSVDRVFEQSMRSTRLQAFYSPLMGFLPDLGLAIILFVGGRKVIHGELSIGDFSAFYLYLVMLSGPVRGLGVALGMSQRAIASGNRLFQVLDREPELTSPPGAPPLPAGGGHVELRDVTLRYPESARLAAVGADPVAARAQRDAALSGVSLQVSAGRTVAIVGPTASGKSSLVALLARLYDPTEGTVAVDGADVKSVDLASLRNEIAFVSEDSFLFSASVADNIAYARPDSPREKVEEAAARAQADSFIRDLPSGYDTVIGERGLTLSGGQRQRIAIARALLAEPRILILDDATSSVDATTEAEIKKGLRAVMEGRTTFIIAHRLSTISLADEIVVMDAGRIVDRGTHEELLDRCPLYAEIAEYGLEDSVYLQRDLESREEGARL
jgi:ABC-type multidrug transport system fused ATPase/permease subunit